MRLWYLLPVIIYLFERFQFLKFLSHDRWTLAWPNYFHRVSTNALAQAVNVVEESFPSGIKNSSRKKKKRRAPPHTTTYRTRKMHLKQKGTLALLRKATLAEWGKAYYLPLL